jgi:hypothetical protein
MHTVWNSGAQEVAILYTLMLPEDKQTYRYCRHFQKMSHCGTGNGQECFPYLYLESQLYCFTLCPGLTFYSIFTFRIFVRLFAHFSSYRKII